VKAFAVVYRIVVRQASMMAFNDVFWMCAWFTAVLVALDIYHTDKEENKVSKVTEE